MTLDPRLRDHIDHLANTYRTGTGDLEQVLGEGRRRVRRRRIVRTVEGAIGVMALVVVTSVAVGFGQPSEPEAELFADGQADVTRGGIAVQRLETDSADLFGQVVATDTDFIVLVTEQSSHWWQTVRGWFGAYDGPDLVAYRTTDGTEWTRTVITSEAFLSEDWGADDIARTSDGTITVLANVYNPDPRATDPPSAAVYTTNDDLEGWERRLIDVTPDRPLPDGLIWEDELATFDLIETGDRPGLIARIGPDADASRFSSYGYDYDAGWSMTNDTGTIRIPIEQVYPDGDADRADTVLVVKGSEGWERLPLTGLPTDDVIDLTFRSGAWYAAVDEGETRTNGLPLVGLYRLDAEWTPITANIVGSPIGFIGEGLQIQPVGIPALGPDVESVLAPEIVVVTFEGAVDRIEVAGIAGSPTTQRRQVLDDATVTTADRMVAVDAGPLLDLDMAAFDVLPPEAFESRDPESGINVDWYRQRLSEDGLVPLAYRDGYLLARRNFRPLEWWVFDLQR